MSRIGVIFKRELAGYFATPIAAVFIVIFLLLAGVFTFYLGNFFERDQADLLPFFNFHPWLYLVLIPALAMRLSFLMVSSAAFRSVMSRSTSTQPRT